MPSWALAGWPDLIHLEGTLAASLKIRGHNVMALISDDLCKAYSKRTVMEGIDTSTWRSQYKILSQECERNLKDFGIDLKKYNLIKNTGNCYFYKINDWNFSNYLSATIVNFPNFISC